MMRVAIGGLGNVGRQLIQLIANDPDLALQVTAVTARDLERARRWCAEHGQEVAVTPADQLAAHADVIVECATYEGFRDIVAPALTAGKHVIAVSIGALATNLDLVELARAHGGVLQVATGALPGLDIVRAAAEGEITDARLISHIRPDSLRREPYVVARAIDLDGATAAPVPVFAGSARAAAAAFPRHFNVGIALSLAGVGFDRTQVEILADANVPGARHRVIVKSDLIDLDLTSQNRPSPDNNRTSRIVAPSLLAALRNLQSPLRVGG